MSTWLTTTLVLVSLVNVSFQFLWQPAWLHNLTTTGLTIGIILCLLVTLKELEESYRAEIAFLVAMNQKAEEKAVHVPGETELALQAKIDDLIERFQAPSTDALPGDYETEPMIENVEEERREQ